MLEQGLRSASCVRGSKISSRTRSVRLGLRNRDNRFGFVCMQGVIFPDFAMLLVCLRVRQPWDYRGQELSLQCVVGVKIYQTKDERRRHHTGFFTVSRSTACIKFLLTLLSVIEDLWGTRVRLLHEVQ